MADTKLSALTELATTPANDDELYIRDVSEVAVDESKRITYSNLVGGVGTKEFFVPVEYSDDPMNKNRWACGFIDAVNEEAWMLGLIPADLTSLTSAELIAVAGAGDGSATMDIDIYTSLAAIGEAETGTNDQELSKASAANCTDGTLLKWDASGAFTAVAASDYFAVQVRYCADATATDAYILGLRIKYS